jgi:CheY-like chemotaxis protein
VAGAQRRARLQAQAAMAALQSSQDRLRVATEFADVGLADLDLAAGRQHVSPIARMSGHLVEVAYNGRRGLEKARQLKPHVVLCDIGLPDLDGYAVARQLRRDASLSSALLVALTGYALPEDRRRALEAGFDRHLSKPPDPEAIAILLDEAPAPGPTGEETAPLH